VPEIRSHSRWTLAKIESAVAVIASALDSSSRAVVRNRRLSFQHRPYPGPLLSAQRRELKSVLCSQCTNNFRRDYFFVGVRQRDVERNELAQHKSLSNESP